MNRKAPKAASSVAACATDRWKQHNAASVNFNAGLKCGILGREKVADLSTFEQYYKLADMLIETATKEQLAGCARLLDSISLTTEQDMANYR
jgi:hypothetical protein